MKGETHRQRVTVLIRPFLNTICVHVGPTRVTSCTSNQRPYIDEEASRAYPRAKPL